MELKKKLTKNENSKTPIMMGSSWKDGIIMKKENFGIIPKAWITNTSYGKFNIKGLSNVLVERKWKNAILSQYSKVIKIS